MDNWHCQVGMLWALMLAYNADVNYSRIYVLSLGILFD